MLAPPSVEDRLRHWLYPPLLVTQGAWTARRTPRLPPASGPREGVAPSAARIPEADASSPGAGPPSLKLLAIGDSIIAGVGVAEADQALPARLAEALAGRREGGVRWVARGRNGARSDWVLTAADQAAGELALPDLVLVSNGINDVTTLAPESEVLSRLTRAIEALEGRFPDAVIAQLGLPPLGVFPALPRPLRTVLGHRSDRIDGALRDWLAPRPRSHWLGFEAEPEPGQFASDGYHPGAAAVAEWAASLADQLRALGAA